ncbi:MAG TPA: hypothetical protein VIJ55_14280 [Acetobacteraceae bacterium]
MIARAGQLIGRWLHAVAVTLDTVPWLPYTDLWMSGPLCDPHWHIDELGLHVPITERDDPPSDDEWRA